MHAHTQRDMHKHIHKYVCAHICTWVCMHRHKHVCGDRISQLYFLQKRMYIKKSIKNCIGCNPTATVVILFVIQGVSRLEDITAAGNFLGLSDQKSAYKHVSDFGRLRSYGLFLIPVHALV